MAANLRPTGPQPVPEPGAILLDAGVLDRVLALGGLATLGTYCRIVQAAQQQTPCTPARLVAACPLDVTFLPQVLAALIAADLVRWVDEDTEGGVA